MRFAHTLGISAASLVCVGSLAACSSSKSSSPATTPTPSASASPAGAPASGALPSVNISAVQQCLQAAGITLPSGGPGGSPPAGAPTQAGGSRPAGGIPSGAVPSGAAGGAFGNNPQVLQALQACGITIPSAAPSAAPSS